MPVLDHTESSRLFENLGLAGGGGGEGCGEEGDQGPSSIMVFDYTERKTHGYNPLESECIYDGLVVRNGLSLQSMPRHYLKQNMSSVIRVAK